MLKLYKYDDYGGDDDVDIHNNDNDVDNNFNCYYNHYTIQSAKC